MAGSAFPTLESRIDRLAGAPAEPLEQLVERLTSEGLLPMREAAKLYGNVHKATLVRHATKGVKTRAGRVIKLEAIRIGGALYTSRAAVLRFFAAQQSTPAEEPAPVPTPAARNRAAAQAHEELAELLG